MPLTSLYRRTDQWIRDLPRGAHAALLGLAAVIGYAVGGLLIGGELLPVRALAMGFTFFVLHLVLGRW